MDAQASSIQMESTPQNPPSSWWPEPNDLNSELAEGFKFGLVRGSGFYFLKGFFRQRSRRSKGRFATGFRLARTRALRVGGVTAAVSGLGEVVRHSLYYYRERDDAFNRGISFAAMGAALMARRGVFPASCTALCMVGFGFLLHELPEKLERWIKEEDMKKMKRVEQSKVA